MQKIVPSLWSNYRAAEMVDLYTRAFGARILNEVRYPQNLPEFQKDFAGQLLTVDIDIQGYRINIVNADDTFAPTPSLSFMITLNGSDSDAAAQLAETYRLLVQDGGMPLMELGSYPWSELYAWVTDRFGVSWQLQMADVAAHRRPAVMPALMFTRGNYTRDFTEQLCTLFTDTQRGSVVLASDDPQRIAYSDICVAGDWIMVSDGGNCHDFTFTCGTSLIVYAKDQNEIDRLWETLSADPEAEQCGWCRDRFGVSWQILPSRLSELMQSPDAYPKLMGMKKIVIADF